MVALAKKNGIAVGFLLGGHREKDWKRGSWILGHIKPTVDTWSYNEIAHCERGVVNFSEMYIYIYVYMYVYIYIYIYIYICMYI